MSTQNSTDILVNGTDKAFSRLFRDKINSNKVAGFWGREEPPHPLSEEEYQKIAADINNPLHKR